MQARYEAHMSWVRHWFPLRHTHEVARNAARWAISNAKVNRWLCGGRYPGKN